MTQIQNYRTAFYLQLSLVASWDNPHCDMIRKIRYSSGYKRTRFTGLMKLNQWDECIST